MKSTFPRALDLVLAHEGGYVDHPRDPGGATQMGITRATLAQWRGKPVSKDDVRNLTRKEAADIYRAKYWQSIRGDDLPAGVDYAVFDFAVNSGVSRAAKYLQAVVGTKQDGIIGGMTLRAVASNSPAAIIAALCDRRLAFLRALKTWPTFGKGWSRRVAGVRKAALEMAGS